VGRYLISKAVLVLPTLLGASIIVFAAIRVLPSDPVSMMLGDEYSPAAATRLRAELGLDDPLPVQYLHYLGGLLHGDLGQSLRYDKGVLPVIAEFFPATIELALISFLLSAVIGLVAGIISAARQYSALDNVLSVTVLFGVCMPEFWTALLAIMVFSLFLGWFPTSGPIGLGTHVDRVTGMYVLDGLLTGNLGAAGDALKHLVLPAVTLALHPTAVIARQMRSAMLETLRQEYVTTARGKGLRERVVIWRHVVRNSVIPVVTLLGLQMGGLLSGAVVIETIFARPGIGWLAITSISVRDYTVVQGVVLVSVTCFIVVNLLVDVLYVYFDPRVKFA
jgi:peptide/nickel transport system permease protein